MNTIAIKRRIHHRSRHTVPINLRVALTVPEAAAMVGISDTALRRLITKGVLATVPHTDRVLIARVELDRWVTSTMGGAA